MGIIGFLGKFAAKKIVEVAAMHTTEIVGSKMHEKITDKNKNDTTTFLETTQSGHSRLVIHQKPYTFKESFKIYDSFENVKYIVKGKLLSAKHNLTLYDASGEVILGKVKEKLIAFRSPISLESHPKDFIIELGNRQLGMMKSRFSFGKRKFEFTFVNWTLKGDFLGLKYRLLDGNETIMEVGERLLTQGDTYFIDIANPKNEILCVLILLAIDSSISSKKHDAQKAREHLFWG